MLLLQGGVRQSPAFYAKLTLPILLGALLAWALLGWLSGVVALVLLTVFAYFLLWLRADRRQRRRVSQLPAFLDNIVPVSYTHLDVYKRQIRRRPSPPRRGRAGIMRYCLLEHREKRSCV